MTRQEFIKKYYPLCRQLSRSVVIGKIYPETALTQAIAESSAKNSAGYWEPGGSLLARKYNNFFGIKASKGWNGRTVELKTPNDATATSFFRVYDTPAESFADYYRFLQTNARYKSALTAANAKDQLKAIAAAGYAENPNAGNLLASLYESVAIVTNQLKPASPLPYMAAGALLLLAIKPGQHGRKKI